MDRWDRGEMLNRRRNGRGRDNEGLVIDVAKGPAAKCIDMDGGLALGTVALLNQIAMQCFVYD